MVFMWPAYRKRVVMTGLRTFDNDICWAGVNFMDGKEIENRYDITLFRKEIVVNYDEVDMDTQMWHYYQPHLTIHVGLNEAAQSFTLQKVANKQGYHIVDNDEKHPDGYRNVCPGPDVDRICTEFNNCKLIKLRDPTLRAELSDDAEKFLFEYIYYTSLCKGRSTRSPTLFVHVPADKYTSEQLAYGLERILELCLKQLSDDDYYSYDVDIDYKHKKV